MSRKRKTAVCLVNLPRQPSTIGDGPSLPLGLLQLSACLEQNSISSEIVDFDFDVYLGKRGRDEEFLDNALARISRTGCRIIGISTASATLPLGILLSRRIKAGIPAACVILGGPGVFRVEREILEAFTAVDIVVSGEGESILPELARAWTNGENLAAVDGIYFRKAGIIVETRERASIRNLDDLPFPLMDRISWSNHLELFRSLNMSGYLPIEVGRGCPKLCAFCASSRFWGGRTRLKSVFRILQEMASASRFGVKGFLLQHDNIGARPGFIAELCRNLARLGSPYRWSCALSADKVELEEIDLMVNAGCTTVLFGVESASPKTQRSVGKRLDLEKAERIIVRCLEAGLRTVITFILGFPEENPEDLEMSLDKIFAYHRMGAVVEVYHLTLLPGTSFWERYRPNGVFAPASNRLISRWIRTCEEEDLIFKHPEVFSSFLVPRPEDYASEEARGASIFFWTLFTAFTQPLCNVIEAARAMGDGPIDVYRSWDVWRRANRPNVPITPDFVYETFNDFLDAYGEDFDRRIKSANQDRSV